ncbi:MAG: quinolinate synthase NadA [candidate division Zixibacteria bacterium]|nr:quinolinate synthase NadA [candidate division Zixibacteria bacterium]
MSVVMAPPPTSQQTPLPERYALLSDEACDELIAEAKAKLGRRVVILGHHYQRDEVIKFADYTGDSFKLAQLASQRPEADYIVFCGVHFMAESADILSAGHQRVSLPDLAAGCSMADMANIDQVEECWEALQEGIEETIVPVTYMNSAANLKAFCGRHGGIVCTSSNAEGVLRWAFERGSGVLFFPDEHLGRNTGLKMGIPIARMPVWNPFRDMGGLTDHQIEESRILLWKGHCSVHQRFTPQQVHEARTVYPDIRVLVHPECRHEVVEMADLVGSTEYIIKAVEDSPAGTQWAIGTEIHLVHRLGDRHPDKLVMSLEPTVCVCTTMYRIDPPHLLWTLENLLEDTVVNLISVPEDIKADARLALDRMLAIHK